MSLFCPYCANLLLSDYTTSGHLGFMCQTCPYVYQIEQRISREVPLPKKKQVDDVLGGDKAWENVDKTNVTCDKCGNGQAYFMQVQTRSADEPSTIFYRCTKCYNRWKEG